MFAQGNHRAHAAGLSRVRAFLRRLPRRTAADELVRRRILHHVEELHGESPSRETDVPSPRGRPRRGARMCGRSDEPHPGTGDRQGLSRQDAPRAHRPHREVPLHHRALREHGRTRHLARPSARRRVARLPRRVAGHVEGRLARRMAREQVVVPASARQGVVSRRLPQRRRLQHHARRHAGRHPHGGGARHPEPRRALAR